MTSQSGNFTLSCDIKKSLYDNACDVKLLYESKAVPKQSVDVEMGFVFEKWNKAARLLLSSHQKAICNVQTENVYTSRGDRTCNVAIFHATCVVSVLIISPSSFPSG